MLLINPSNKWMFVCMHSGMISIKFCPCLLFFFFFNYYNGFEFFPDEVGLQYDLMFQVRLVLHFFSQTKG